ncbi:MULTISPECIES: hypothetical protein [Mycobacterium]|jgi:hypothetical protein|uniref:Uncharacterized protein n=1 Tax=Mycobacterium kiyosense TaxID=2871094 RepID=A0AA37Q6F5_9MYCO|nr:MULTISPECIES: hypothetical protein [Mycobacterium]BDE17289.1 hypothetical protein MKCMC460_61490 [Mycobacterium sp. 20KCMC460]GLB86922.1 hypothetical protein SRL2020028_61780 [Mycobacterium kiyosense]GLB91751.1 hypothetical protein SRL2020130_45680 [Mycobacterium kiyosense]GLB98794.1 hypothetical protein SRL2020226_55700 [Mycobacterium kiyosense]GLC05337.1 hypothetical protein SRL2020400_59280 [Mycobacterium kiyosense]
MTAYGQITSGYWPAVLIGVVMLLIYVATTTAAIMRRYRLRRKETLPEPIARLSDPLPSDMGASLWRCRALIAEALIVRQRLSGEIDAETYRARMNDLARPAIPGRRPQRSP